MARKYTVTKAADLTTATATGINTDITRVPGVGAMLRSIRDRGDHLAAWDSKKIADWRYTNLPENRDGVLNHFQGFQRLRSGQYFALSGGDWNDDSGSHVFIFKMSSRPPSGLWHSNLLTGSDPPAEDALVRLIEVDQRLWHAGGMDTLGDILAVPVEQGPKSIIGSVGGAGRDDPPESRIVFFDLSDPESPKRFPHSVDRPGAMATCVALTRLGNGFFVLAVWSGNPDRIEFYVSASTRFTGKFRTHPDQIATWKPNNQSPTQKFSGYQTMNFVHEQDRRLYLIGFGTTSLVAGEHVAQVYSVDIPGAGDPIPPGQGLKKPIKVARVPGDQIQLKCPKSSCDFSGAAGLYISDPGLVIYSGAQYRTKKGVFKFTEFRPSIAGSAAPIRALGDGWVELYSEAGFEGSALAITDLRLGRGDIPKYSKVKVTSQKFENRAMSARWQLPKGKKYRLYAKEGYKTRVAELIGTGKIEHIADFEQLGFAKRVRSSRLV